MKIGVSTACFYPERTFDSLKTLVDNGVKDIEIFFNTDSETSAQSLELITRTVDDAGCNICAVHPYHCAFDWFYLFTGYEDRINDGIAMYQRFFEAVRFLGVKIVSFHGEHKNSILSPQKSFEIIKRLADTAKKYDITLCLENVARNKLRSAEDISDIRHAFDDNIAFTIDIKQARRSDESPLSLIDAAGECLKHLHISGNSDENDCIAPNIEDHETVAILERLSKNNYDGHVIIELYKDGYRDNEELIRSYNELKKFVEISRI